MDNFNDHEYEPSFVSEEVLDFLRHFRDAINMGNVYDIERFYEHEFPKLSDRYYKNEEWPHQLDILSIFEDDIVFATLYNELCYRHMYARIPGGPSCEQRIASFLNYCDFFNLILSGAYPVTLKLPNIWLWELVDEFVYQFQNFALYRNRTDRNKNELKQVSNRNIWSILCILNVFHSLIEKSNIKLQLEVEAAGGDPETVAGEYGRLPFYKMLGYFSMIGLLRVHSILGDYYQAIKILEPIEIQKKTQFTQIPACQITTSYYVGYSYMMMRRYSDAIRTFSSILLYIQRTKQMYSQRSYQNDQINKQTDQMYHLLAMCLVLNPQYIDESIQQALRDKMHNEMYKMQCGDKDVFKNFFTVASPKFVLPYIRTVKPDPDSEDPEDVILNEDDDEDLFRDPMENQTKIFLTEVEQQLQLPTIRTYLKMYTTLPLEKLAGFIVMKRNNNEPDPEPNVNKLLIQLLCLKHKMKSVVWTKGSSALDGTISTGSELDFYIDDDMIHIADTKVSQRYGDFFIRKILKFEELNRRLHNSKV